MRVYGVLQGRLIKGNQSLARIQVPGSTTGKPSYVAQAPALVKLSQTTASRFGEDGSNGVSRRRIQNQHKQREDPENHLC